MSDKTYSPKLGDIQRQWFVVDATDKTLGRLASKIAQILRGKHKPIYAPHADVGDHVIVINADKIKVSGRKAEQKIYYRHTGYMGGMKEKTYKQAVERKPDFALRNAVKGMLPKNFLKDKRLTRLIIEK